MVFIHCRPKERILLLTFSVVKMVPMERTRRSLMVKVMLAVIGSDQYCSYSLRKECRCKTRYVDSKPLKYS